MSLSLHRPIHVIALLALASLPKAAVASESRDFSAWTDLVMRRVALAEPVAQYKFVKDLPIEVPEREREVLDERARRAAAQRLDPQEVREFFVQQIEASKLRQRQWFVHFDLLEEVGHPLDPSRVRDINETRNQLDDVDGVILQQWRRARVLRNRPQCTTHLQAGIGRSVDAMGGSRTQRTANLAALQRALQGFCRS